MRSVVITKKIIYLLAIFVFLLTGCSDGSCNTNNQNQAIPIGTLPNGSVVWLSANNLAVSYGKPATATISLTGGAVNESFILNFASNTLQSAKRANDKTPQLSDLSGLIVMPKQCNLGTSGSGLSSTCTLMVSSESTLISNIYQINPTALSVDGKTTKLSPITALVSNPLNPTSNSATYFVINNVPAKIINNTVSVILPSGTDLTALVSTYVVNGESVTVNGVPQINGETVNDFSNSTNTPLIYAVVAQNGQTQDYQVIVTTAPTVANSITAFSIDGNSGTQSDNNTFTVIMPSSSPLTDLVARFTTTGTVVKVGNAPQVNGISMNDFSASANTPIVYTVVSADGSTKNYNVIVKNAQNTAKSINGFTLNGNDFTANIDESQGVITAQLPYGTDLKLLTVGYNITGSSMTLVGSNVELQSGYSQDFTNPITYTVYAADGSSQNYVVTASTALNQANQLTSFTIDGVTGDVNGNTFVVTLPYHTDLNNLVASFTTSGVAVKIGNVIQVSGSTVHDFSNSATTPIVYTIYAADGSSQAYNIIVKSAPKNSFAYISNYDSTYTICALNGTDGTLESCNVKSSLLNNGSSSSSISPSSYIWGVTVHNGFSYFANGTDNTYTKCTINNTDGTLYDCSNIAPPNGYAMGNLSGITFYQGYAYITDVYYDSVTICSVNNVDGTLFNCNVTIPTGAGALNSPMDISINNGYAYIANTVYPGSYTQCTVNSTTGALFNCNTVVLSGSAALSDSYGVVVSNGYAYFSNWYTHSYTQCTVNSANGTLFNCNTVTPPSLFYYPMGVAIKNGYIYVVYRNNCYMKCSINSADGTLTNCSNVSLPGILNQSMKIGFY